jgi:hypothetical protein
VLLDLERAKIGKMHSICVDPRTALGKRRGIRLSSSDLWILSVLRRRLVALLVWDVKHGLFRWAVEIVGGAHSTNTVLPT